MYKIKQLPEDFIVKEISNVKIETNGQYAYFLLKKINYTTIDALQVLSNKFKIPLKNFGFAGNKDRNAITEQKISIFRGSKNFKNDKFNNIELTYIGNGKNPISIIIPCHRVIGADGKLVGYSGDMWRKQWLLNHESRQESLF